jgi:hypothetical protein
MGEALVLVARLGAACGPYVQRCPSLWHNEHIGFSPGQRAFFRLKDTTQSVLHIKSIAYSLSPLIPFTGGVDFARID